MWKAGLGSHGVWLRAPLSTAWKEQLGSSCCRQKQNLETREILRLPTRRKQRSAAASDKTCTAQPLEDAPSCSARRWREGGPRGGLGEEGCPPSQHHRPHEGCSTQGSDEGCLGAATEVGPIWGTGSWAVVVMRPPRCAPRKAEDSAHALLSNGICPVQPWACSGWSLSSLLLPPLRQECLFHACPTFVFWKDRTHFFTESRLRSIRLGSLHVQPR